MTESSLHFVRRGEVVQLDHVGPNTTLLEVLRERLGCTGTKEGCGEGDCGACTVVIADTSKGQISYKAINSCIRTAHSVAGMAVWTVEDLGTDPLLERTEPPTPSPTLANATHKAHRVIPLHPVQQAMVDAHASQCGFCTPGFVMSMFAMYQNTQQGNTPVTREFAQETLSGNLCRCTGYRPILEAACKVHDYPAVKVKAAPLKALLQQAKRQAPLGLQADYLQPTTLDALLEARAKRPNAQLVAGCTDVGLWITKMHKEFAQILDVTRVAELSRVETYPHHVAIGAAVSLEEAFASLLKARPQLHEFAKRFAGLPVRNSGTLGGNVANGSPIGDSMPLLIAMGANVVLSRRVKGQTLHRELPLERLYTGYRTNVMKHDEVLTWIKVPKPTKGELLKVYKISKRFDDDISAVCLAIRLQVQKGQVVDASVGVGGVAATPVRAIQAEASLRGKPWTQTTAEAAAQTLAAEFSPISDMRATGDYRRTLLSSLMQRFWLESQGQHNVSVYSPSLVTAAGEMA